MKAFLFAVLGFPVASDTAKNADGTMLILAGWVLPSIELSVVFGEDNAWSDTKGQWLWQCHHFLSYLALWVNDWSFTILI